MKPGSANPHRQPMLWPSHPASGTQQQPSAFGTNDHRQDLANQGGRLPPPCPRVCQRRPRVDVAVLIFGKPLLRHGLLHLRASLLQLAFPPITYGTAGVLPALGVRQLANCLNIPASGLANAALEHIYRVAKEPLLILLGC